MRQLQWNPLRAVLEWPAPRAAEPLRPRARRDDRRVLRRLWAHVRIIRVPETAMVLAGTWIGWRLAGLAAGPVVVWTVAVSNSLLFAASMVFNDARDVREDTINKPTRPIPAGLVKIPSALALAALLFATGVGLAFSVRPVLGAVAAAVSAASIAYTFFLKRSPLVGNAVVAALSAYPLWCWFLWEGAQNRGLMYLSVTCAGFRLGAEIIKTAEDLRGDIASGLRTVATLRGESFANRLGSASLAVALAFSWLPVPALGVNPVFVVLMVAASVLVVAACATSFRSREERRRGAPSPRLVQLQRAVMVLGCLAYLFGL